jgi:hypothetical protein
MFWDTPKDNTVDVSDTSWYGKFENIHATTAEGYRCDPLQPSPVVFLGSCDVNGPLPDPSLVWSKIIHSNLVQKRGQFPYISMGRMHTACQALVRRLNGFCDTYGPPKEVYIVLPRPVCLEVPIRGMLVNVAERSRYVNFLVRSNKITNDERQTLMKAVNFNRSQKDNPDYQMYIFEQVATTLKLLAKAYNIKVRWTVNLAAPATVYYAQWLEMFLHNNQFMRETFVGVAEMGNLTQDGCAGALTQANLAYKLLADERETIEQSIKQARENVEILKRLQPETYERLFIEAEVTAYD